MQAVVLAVNQPTELATFSRNTPVAMLPVADRPAASLIIEQLARNGCRDIVVCLYQQDESIEAYLGSGRRWGVNIRYLLHRQPLGTAGMLNRAMPYLSDTCIVLPAGTILDLDIADALDFHRRTQSSLTMILHTPLATCTQAHVQLDAAGRVQAVGQLEAPLVSTGAYIIEPHTLPYIPTAGAPNVETDLVPLLLEASLPVMGYEAKGYWNTLETLNAYQAAQRDYLLSAWRQGPANENANLIRHASINLLQIAPGIWIGKNHAIHPTANIAAPVCIGDNCLIGRDVALGPFAIIGRDVIVDDEATINNSTVLPNTYVGRLVNIESRIVNKGSIGDPLTAKTTEVVDEFLLSETRPGQILDVVYQWVNTLIALLLLLISLPFTLLLSLAVFITSEAQLLAPLERVNGRRTSPDGSQFNTFGLLRFQTRRRNGRYSLIGRLLERLDWDKLPELLNVIHGDLRLVGVKPLTLDEASQVTEEWQARRFICQAGFTGLWYVQARRGADLDEILVTDAYYASTRSWRDDASILLHTPIAWFRRTFNTDHTTDKGR
jgi:NDP-sugar pyrophosphorylase family protein